MTGERRAGPLQHSVVGWLLVAACAVRHQWFWGGDWGAALGAAEGVALVAFSILAARAWYRAVIEAPTTEPRQLWRGGIILTALGAAIPPFLSTDLFDYVARGRVEFLHGANPYVRTTGEFSSIDPFMEAAGWPDHAMPYGPLAAAMQWAVAAVAGDRIWVGVYAFKLVFAACHVGTAWLVSRTAAPTDGPARRRMLAAWLWNPFLILESANSGHNEAIMALWLGVMVWACRRDRMALATGAFGMAVLFKHGCAVLGPLLLALACGRRQRVGFGAGVMVTAAVTTPLAWHYFADPASLEVFTRQAAVLQASLQAAVDGLWGDAATRAVRATAVGAVLGALAWAVVAMRHPTSLGNRGARVTLVFIALFMGQFAPWYHLWWLPLVGLWDARGLDRMFAALTALGPLSYVVLATRRSLETDHQIAQWVIALALPLLAAACVRPRIELPQWRAAWRDGETR